MSHGSIRPPRRPRPCWALPLLGALASAGCSSGGDVTPPSATPSSDAAAGAGSSSSGAGAGDGGTAQSTTSTGPMSEGWQKVFAKDGVGLTCAMSAADMRKAGAPSLTFGAATIFVGFEQIGQNQDPVFARFDGDAKTYCEHHEREAPDGRALGLTWDGGATAYVVYTIVGGGSAFDAKAKGGWLERYGDGGGSSKVSFLGVVETARGTLESGTFVVARKKDGKTNTHGPSDALTRLPDGRLEFHGSSAFQPLNGDRSIMECTDYPFDTLYVFAPDLKTVACASSTNCTAKAACR